MKILIMWASGWLLQPPAIHLPSCGKTCTVPALFNDASSSFRAQSANHNILLSWRYRTPFQLRNALFSYLLFPNTLFGNKHRYEFVLACSQTQLCHIGVFIDCVEQLHVSAFIGHRQVVVRQWPIKAETCSCSTQSINTPMWHSCVWLHANPSSFTHKRGWHTS